MVDCGYQERERERVAVRYGFMGPGKKKRKKRARTPDRYYDTIAKSAQNQQSATARHVSKTSVKVHRQTPTR